MKKLSLLLLGLLLLLLCAGCSSIKRFNSASWKGTDNTLVEVDLFGVRLSDSPGEMADRNLWSLSANAQTRLIQILDGRYSDNEQFVQMLNHRYLSETGYSATDLTRKNLRMVFSVQRDRDFRNINDASSRFTPADRIEFLKVTLEIPSDHQLRFTNWNRYATEYGEVDIADVAFSRNVEMDAEGQIGASDVGAKAAFSRNEKQEIRSRYLKLNGSLSDHEITLEAEGTREIDLAGNIIADLTMEFGGFPERIVIPLFSGDSDGTNGCKEVIALTYLDVLVPRMEEAPDTLYAVLSMEYVYRHVQSGWKTFAEWDDQVEYYTGKVSKPVPLLTKRDYLPPFYCLKSEQEEDVLKFRLGSGKEYLLQFKDYRDAREFLDWLERVAINKGDFAKLGSSQLLFQGKPLSLEDLTPGSLSVVPVY